MKQAACASLKQSTRHSSQQERRKHLRDEPEILNERPEPRYRKIIASSFDTGSNARSTFLRIGLPATTIGDEPYTKPELTAVRSQVKCQRSSDMKAGNEELKDEEQDRTYARSHPNGETERHQYRNADGDGGDIKSLLNHKRSTVQVGVAYEN
eukprot:756021-Hanusia_phi.AAC.1